MVEKLKTKLTNYQIELIFYSVWQDFVRTELTKKRIIQTELTIQTKFASSEHILISIFDCDNFNADWTINLGIYRC